MTTDHEAKASNQAIPIDPNWDWRDVGGRTFITPAGNQGGTCQSSTAFAITAAMNAWLRIKAMIDVGHPDESLLPELSPADVFYCGGGKCADGLSADDAFAYAAKSGVVLASDIPYTPGDQPCQRNRGGLLMHVNQLSGFKVLETRMDMKLAIASTGPVVATFKLHKDFLNYAGGVYHWDKSSAWLYDQTVCVVGCDHDKQAWACKNSWGPNWGPMQGCFYIGYGECGIDDKMWQIAGFTKTFPYGSVTGNPAATCQFQGQVHVFHRDINSQLRDFYWANGAPSPSLPQWISRGPALDPSNLSAVFYSPFNQLHVCYRDVTGNIADDVYSQPYPREPDIWEWSYQAITGPGGPTAAPLPVGAPQALILNKQMHVCYRDASGNVHDVYYDGAAWHWAQLTGTQLPGGPVPQTKGGPPAVGDPKVGLWNGQIHVCYRAFYGFVWRVYSATGTSWTLEGLIGPDGVIDGSPAAGECCIMSFASQLHICYRDVWGYIKDAYFTDTWNYQTLTDRGAAAGDPVAMDYSRFYQMHVCYRDPQGCIQDVFYDGNAGTWTKQQLTGPGSLTKAPQAAGDADPVAFEYSYKDAGGTPHYEMHVVYRDIQSNLRDAWYDGSTWRQLAL